MYNWGENLRLPSGDVTATERSANDFDSDFAGQRRTDLYILHNQWLPSPPCHRSCTLLRIKYWNQVYQQMRLIIVPLQVMTLLDCLEGDGILQMILAFHRAILKKKKKKKSKHLALASFLNKSTVSLLDHCWWVR